MSANASAGRAMGIAAMIVVLVSGVLTHFNMSLTAEEATAMGGLLGWVIHYAFPVVDKDDGTEDETPNGKTTP